MKHFLLVRVFVDSEHILGTLGVNREHTLDWTPIYCRVSNIHVGGSHPQFIHDTDCARKSSKVSYVVYIVARTYERNMEPSWHCYLP